MKLRVYGIKGIKGRFEEFILTKDEQKSWYEDCLNRVIANPRWYLDNLEYLPEFRVNWNHYPHRRLSKQKDL